MRCFHLIAVVVTLSPTFSAGLPAGLFGGGGAKASPTTKAAASAATAAAAAGRGGTGTTTVSNKQVANAVVSWMNDTGKVTNFLNMATSFTGVEFTRQATIALNAEKDELNHKKILDAVMSTNPDVKAANNVLEKQGTFQMVVNVLQKMVTQGPDTAQADVDAINKNRCVNVLPNIDKYFAAAGSSTVSAVRPTGCLEIASASSTGSATVAAGSAASAASSTRTATVAAGKSAAAAASLTKTPTVAAGKSAAAATAAATSKTATISKPAAVASSSSVRPAPFTLSAAAATALPTRPPGASTSSAARSRSVAVQSAAIQSTTVQSAEEADPTIF